MADTQEPTGDAKFEAFLVKPDDEEVPDETPEDGTENVSDEDIGEPDEEPDEGEDADDEDSEPLAAITDDTVIKHKWDRNGPEEEITLKELKEGALRWKDYTQKTQALNAEREQALTEARTAAREEYKGALLQWAVAERQEPDWITLAQQVPPQQYNAYRAQWDAESQRINEAKQLYTQLAQEDQAREQEEYNARLEREKAALIEAVPEFGDEKKAGVMLQKVQKAAHYLGYTDDELRGIADDHRIVRGLMLISAHLESQGKRPALADKLASATSHTLPKQGRASRVDKTTLQKQARSQLRKKGDDDSFIGFLTAGT